MMTRVSYQGKNLGKIRLNENATNKNGFVFIAESLESLAQLFQIKSDEFIEVEGRGEIPYAKFQEDTLPRITSYYPTFDHWFCKDERFKPGV